MGCTRLGGVGCFGCGAIGERYGRGFGGSEQQLVELVFETAFQWADTFFDVDAQLD